MDEHPCQIPAPHGRHDWTPIVVDPADDHVFHVFADLPMSCPGVTTTDWLATR